MNTRKRRELAMWWRILTYSCIALAILVWLGGCVWQPAASHSLNIGACMPGDHTEFLTSAVMYDRASTNGWHLQVGYHEMLQIAVVKEIGLTRWSSFYAGTSYLQHSSPIGSQLNARVSLSAGPLTAMHDSNGDLTDQNTGINCVYLRVPSSGDES